MDTFKALFIVIIIAIVTLIAGFAGNSDITYSLEEENQELKTAIESYNIILRNVPDDIFLDVISETDEYDYIIYINSKYNLD